MSAVKEMQFGAAEAPAAKEQRMPRLLLLLTIVTIVAVVAGLYLSIFYAGTDMQQGDVQRLFYIHVPSFAGAFVAFTVAVVGGVLYLITRNVRWDTLALAGVEAGLVLSIVNIVTGSAWARPIWNTWWNWDPRLTMDAIMILTYSAYLMLRNGIDNPETRRRFASVYEILAFITVLATLLITRFRADTIHPVVFGPVFTAASQMNAVGAFELAATPGVSAVVGYASAVWSILVPVVLIWHRVRVENLAERVNALRMRLLSE